MGDEFAGLRQKRACEAPGCVEQVAFSLFASAVGQDEAKYWGTCANGHVNVLTAESRKQWVEDER